MNDTSDIDAAGRSSRPPGTAAATCPQCGSERVRPIVWGYPEPGSTSPADRDRFVFGGCVVTGDDPDTACLDCEARWTSR